MTYCGYRSLDRHLAGAHLFVPGGAPQDEHPSFALPGDRPHYAPDRPADVRHIHIDIAVDFERQAVSGSVTTTFVTLFEHLREVTFNAAEMQIERVTMASSNTALDHWSEGERLHVRLDRAYTYGDEFGVVIQYAARPRWGLYFIAPDQGDPDRPVQVWSQGETESNHYWFPCCDAPNDRASTALDATVPARFFALSNGRLEGVTEHKKRGSRTYRWRQDVPHPAYLITLVAGAFAELRDSWRNIPVNAYVQPGREADGHTMFDKTPAMMEFYSSHFGVDYPYEKYAQVVVELFLAGAMENTSATTHSFRLLPDTRASLDWKPDPVVAHELVHQWFGDLLTCRDWGHIWLNESFATYFQMAWTQHNDGEDEFRVELRNNFQAYLDADAQGRRPIVFNVYHSDGQELFDRHVYEKGSLVLHLLRFVLGDAPFWRAIQAYAQNNRGREVITADLERAVEETTGRSVARFFEEWVYGAGHPQFKVTYTWDDEHRMARVGVTQKQAQGGKETLFHTPVEIAFAVPDAENARADDTHAPVSITTFRLNLDEAEQTFYFPLTRRPLMVRFDPGARIPKTLEFERPAELVRFQLRRDEDVLGRIEAAEALGKLGDPESVDALAQALLDEPFWAVRSAIAAALGRQRSTRALDALLAGLERTQEPKARRAIAAALGAFRVPEQPALANRAAQALSALLEHGDPSYFVEAAAATALGKTRTSDAYDRLVAVLERPSWNETIRQGAFIGLAELAEPRAAAILTSWLLDRTRSADTRQAAATGLRALADTRRLGPGEARTNAVEAACAALDDPWAHVVYRALAALHAFGDDLALPAIQRLVDSTVDTTAIRLGREALAAIRSGQTREDETRHLRTDVDATREESRQLRERLESLEARLGTGNAAQHNKHKRGRASGHGKSASHAAANGRANSAYPSEGRARKEASTKKKAT